MTNYEAGLSAGRAEGVAAVLKLSERIEALEREVMRLKSQHQRLGPGQLIPDQDGLRKSFSGQGKTLRERLTVHNG